MSRILCLNLVGAFFALQLRYVNLVADNLIVRKISQLVLFFYILASFGLSANPFIRFNEEIEKSVGSEKKPIFNLFGKQDSEVSNLFGQGVNNQGEEGDSEVASLDLPKYLEVSPVVSNRVVHESGIIIKRYTVQKKDNLSKIARSLGQSVSKIRKQNGLKSNKLKFGQVLEVSIQIKNASSSRVIKKKIFILPVPQSRITSRFGRRVDPFNKYNRVYHTGLDLAAKVGTPVVASALGEVIFTGRNGGYGNSVTIQHKNGFKTVYAHCSQILVEVGETVKMGRVIAAVGRTGSATGAHLHFEVFLNGKLMNPETALHITEKFVTKLPKSEIAGI